MNRATTPAPWHYSALTKSFGVYDSQGTAIAKVGGAYGVAHERRQADARLIAAAPELAASGAAFLQWFRAFIGDAAYNEIRADELDSLRAALAKAGV